MDEFTLNPDPTSPGFDFGNVQTPPFVSPVSMPTPAGGQKPQDKMQLMKLALLLPLAMKHGPGAVQGLMQGFAQHEQQQYTRGRQDATDHRAQTAADQQRQYQQGQLHNQQLTQQRQFLGDFTKGIEGLDTPEAVDAYTKLYSQQGQVFGLGPDMLNQYAAPYKEPTRLQQRAAENYVKKLKSEYGEKWMDTAAQFTHRVGGQTLSFNDLLAQAGMAKDPTAPVAEPKADTRSLDVQAADALARGDTATYQRLLKVKKEMGQADDKPSVGRDPVMEAIHQLQLQQMQNGGGNLPSKTMQQVQSQAKAYESLPVVKNTQVMAEASQFANSLDPQTTNPADDQALIYAFAKAMDPNSVVREGEYATVQKYAQSWAQSFGFNAQRIFSNTAFLTPEARQNMKRTIQQRFRAARGQYDVVRKSYVQKINKLTNQQDGEAWLTDYGAGFPADAAAPASAGVTVHPPADGGGSPAAAPGANPFRRGQ